MNPPSAHEPRATRALDRALRDLPNLPAPPALERRVLAAIAREKALPWWRRDFQHWPVAARGGFLVLTLGLASLGLVAVPGTPGNGAVPFPTRFAGEPAWLDALISACSAVRHLGEILLRHLPPLWLYAALAVVAAAHAACVGLGAAAYRALRPPLQD